MDQVLRVRRASATHVTHRTSAESMNGPCGCAEGLLEGMAQKLHVGPSSPEAMENLHHLFEADPVRFDCSHYYSNDVRHGRSETIFLTEQ